MTNFALSDGVELLIRCLRHSSVHSTTKSGHYSSFIGLIASD
jgi:hypothetical protein